MGRLSECRLIELRDVVDWRGSLIVAEEHAHVPFPVKRVFFLHAVPEGGSRGGHAHHNLHQMMIAITGKFDVILDDGITNAVFRLDRPTVGLYVPPMIWREMKNFSANAINLVLASLPYSAEDYIRDRGEFERLSRSAAK
jgi:hypothetical protein